jgi:hypothetical protein
LLLRASPRGSAPGPLVISDAFNARRIDTLALPGAVKVFGDVKPEPDLPNLEKAVAMAREVKPDLVLRRRQRHGSCQAGRGALHQ